MLLFGLLVHLTVLSFSLTPLPSNGQPVQGSDPVFARLALIAAGATFALLLMGAYARGEGAGLAFPDWPLMDGRLIPDLGGPATAHFLHRAGAAAVGVLVLYVAVRSWRMPSRSADLVALATGAAALFVVQVFVGAASVWTELAAPAVVAHVAISALIWGTLVALASVSRRLARGPASEPVDTTPARASLGRATASYFQLTKPRIVVLLLVTTVPTMVLAARGVPSLWLVAATLLGGSVAAGGANAINCYLDRDIDEVMRRTRSRPLPAGRVTPEDALTFGLALGTVSFVWLSLSVNVLAALLSLSAILFYVLVYTAWLKRSTPQNIVIGGAAGAVPVLVGWAAVTGSVGPPALVLFAIVFLWTPPHFWALALRHTKEYAAARIPMLPVVKGERRTTRSILAYSVVLVATTLLLYPVAHMGAIYLAAAVGLGGVLVHRAWRLRRNLSPALAWGLFKFSISYLGLLFAAVAVDRLLPIGI
jgi:protoheme IX farnesyltransferase